jgi:ankyrin repeat protein
VKSLYKLETIYRADPLKVSNQHVGVCIEKMADITPYWCRHWPKVNERVHVITNFVLDLIKDKAKLDEIDQEGFAPLHVAFRCDMKYCFEMLLARGANPDLQRGNQTPQLRNLTKIIEFERIFAIHTLLKHWSYLGKHSRTTGHIFVAWMWEHRIVKLDLDQMSLFQLWGSDPLGLDLQEKVWIHVPFTSVSKSRLLRTMC